MICLQLNMTKVFILSPWFVTKFNINSGFDSFYNLLNRFVLIDLEDLHSGQHESEKCDL